MPRTGRAAVLATTLLLAAPVGAWAQTGAGDEQYQDPFAEENSGNGTGSGSGDGNTSRMSETMPGAQGGAEGSGRLPNTGADPGLVALLGTGLLLTGAGLRVRVRRPIA